MNKTFFDSNYICSSYNEDTPEELNYYAKSFRIGDVAYLHDKEDDSIKKMQIVESISRSNNPRLYDKLIENDDVLIHGEEFHDADTSAEFIYDDDCVLVWFKFVEE